MSHLSTERLAALADERPTTDELAHLSHCSSCEREIEAHRSLRTIAEAERDAMRLPLTRWDTLSQRLRSEGLIAAGGAPSARLRSRTSHLPLRVAAALLLLAGGAVLGRVSAGASAIPGGLTGAEGRRASGTLVDARLGAAPQAPPATFESVEDATRWKSYYADAYQSAVSYLATNDSTARPVGTPAVMRARLSALDRVSRTMQEALNDAPFDPVINDFYLNSFGQREATLRQLNTVLPQGVRLNSF